jgi:hypothetical protein
MTAFIDGNYEYINKEKVFPHNSGSHSTVPQSQIDQSSENGDSRSRREIMDTLKYFIIDFFV